MPTSNRAKPLTRAVHHVRGEILQRARLASPYSKQEVAAAQAGISVRTLKTAEAGGKVSVATILKLAKVYYLSASEIAPDLAAVKRVEGFLQQQIMPPQFDEPTHDAINEALVLDMEGNSEGAVAIYRRLLEQDASYGLELRAHLRVRLATALDNAGKPHEALENLRHSSGIHAGHGLSEAARASIRYHEGLALMHLGNWNEARSLFLTLSKLGAFRPSALHQMGVGFLGVHAEKVNASLLKLAWKCFTAARKCWHMEGNYREGHSLRRLAEVAALRGDSIAAVELLLDALECFARHGCRRYLLDVRERLRHMRQLQ